MSELKVVVHNFMLVGLSVAAMVLMVSVASCNGVETTSPEDELDSILGTRSLIVGENRFTFVIASRDGQIIENADVEAQFQMHNGEVIVPKTISKAMYKEQYPHRYASEIALQHQRFL